MDQHPQAIMLSNVFKNQLDPQGLGYIAKETFRGYINKQTKPLQYYEIEQLFGYLENLNKMSEKQFVTFMMGYNQGLKQIAFARLAFTKQASNFMDASPSAGPSELLHSFVKLEVLGKDKKDQKHRKKCSLSIGKNEGKQLARRQQYQNLMGRQLSKLNLVMKFKVNQNIQKISSCLESILADAKSIASQMLDPEMNKIIQMLQISVKHSQHHLYIFVQLSNSFIDDTILFINQMIQSINPSSQFVIGLDIHSDDLQTIANKPQNFHLPQKFTDLQIDIKLEIDGSSKQKINQIFNENYPQTQTTKFPSIMFLLLKQIQLESKFVNSQSLLKELGIKNQVVGQLNESIGSLQQFQIGQTLTQFLPSFGQFLELVKQNNIQKDETQNNGEISINAGSFFFRLQYNLNLKGLLNLL